MTTEEQRRDRIVRHAETYESRLLRDIDALSQRAPLEAVRKIQEHGPALRKLAIALAAGLAVSLLALVTVRVVRALR
jgi:hypothetical protein